MVKTADAVIIGGGMAGASTLFHLTQRGICDVLLIEKEEGLAQGTTRYTAGQVMKQLPDELHMRLSLATFDEFRMLQEGFAVDVSFRRRGLLTLGTNKHSDELRGRAILQKSLGVPVEILLPEQIGERAPFLVLDDIELGLFCEDDGTIDANALVHDYAKLARDRGAVVKLGMKAIRIALQNRTIVGVETEMGFVHTPIVINAAGIHAKEVGDWVGLDLPLSNALRHNVFMRPLPIVPEDMPMLEVLNSEVLYIGSRGQQLDWTIGTFPTDRFEHKPDWNLLMDTHGEDLERRAPVLADTTKVFRYEAGIRCATPDFFPILGPVDEISGYYNNCGWGGYGITNGPAGAALLADCIAGASRSSMSIEHFLLRRFRKS